MAAGELTRRIRQRLGASSSAVETTIHVHTLNAHLGLLDDVEVVDAAAGEARHRNPVAPVAAHVIVEQHRLKVVRAAAPVDAQVQHQIGCHILAAAVAHEACICASVCVCARVRVLFTNAGKMEMMAVE
eukprot:364760-Chlamydomonas_euryale.AAC.10